MRQHLNPIAQQSYDRHYNNAIKGGCDKAQAESIARENTLAEALRTSAAITEGRAKLAAYRE